MKRIVFLNDDGSIGIIVPAPKGMKKSESEEAFLNRIIAKDVPADKPWRLIEVDEVPSDRTFRNAWTCNQLNQQVSAMSVHAMSGGLSVDMDKAKNIKMDELRGIRDEKLKGLDLDYMRADEANDAAKKADIVSKKQALRDMPATADIGQITTPDQLKEYCPDCLK